MSDIPSHEVFDSNYDYLFAAEQKKNPRKGLAQIMGAKALNLAGVGIKKAGNWLRGMNEKRKAEKAERKQNGSLNELYAAGEDQERQDTNQPRPVLAEAGLYRSNYSGEQPELQVTDTEQDDIMQAAAYRARKALGELPVLAMHQPEQIDDDEALIARLKKAYEQPARQDADRNITPPDRHDDDRLVGTQGK